MARTLLHADTSSIWREVGGAPMALVSRLREWGQ
jgi:hypothetical protein